MFWCLGLRSVKVLVFTTFFSSVTLRQMYQSCFSLCIVLTGQVLVTIILSTFSWGFLNGLNSSPHKPTTLRELGTGSLVYEVPWFGTFLKIMWIILGSIITKYYFGYAMSCKYTSQMDNNYIWWSIWLLG